VIRTLFSAVAQDDMATIEALLAKGVDVNAKNESGQTALMIAARYARTTIVQFLVAKGADPNIKDKQGWTALKHAQSSPEIVNILKNAKAKK
jgi:ankyrin repeat protein